MKVGDLVKHCPAAGINLGVGIIVHIDKSHRQIIADVAFTGKGVHGPIWIKNLEVISESR